ncbi:MAG: hypothetical protein AABX16_00730 [Nanoarchaeota archaeon]
MRGGTVHEKAIVLRHIGRDSFKAHVDDGDYRWEEEVTFLDNTSIFEAMVNDAKKNPHWRSNNQKFPHSYHLDINNVNYYIQDCSLLTSGKQEEFEEAWLHRVYYANDAQKLERE